MLSVVACTAALGLQGTALRLRPAFTDGRASRSAMLLDGGTSTWLADAAILLPDASEVAGAAVTNAVAAADTAVAADPSWFDSLVVNPFMFAISALHDAFKSFGVDEAWGPAIISFTIGVKLLTLPLTKTQIESTTKMQAIAPAAKALQEKYRERDPARLNSELQKLYQDNQVNPLAGCIPALAQIPLFIGLYRSLLNLANEDRLSESFLFLPSLEGPVRSYTEGIGWLTEWQNGAPKLGWSDTLSYLVLPVILVASQYASTALLTPKTDDPAQQQSQAILKFLPLMIGWFALSVPSGLGLYWLTNNVVTTATTLAIRATVSTPDIAAVTSTAAPAAAEPKPAGFGRKYGEIIESSDGAGNKVTIRPPGAPRADATVVDVAANDAVEATAIEPDGAPRVSKKKKKKGKAGKRKN